MRTLAGRCLLAGAAAIAALTAAELAARTVEPRFIRSRRMIADPQVGFRQVPGLRLDNGEMTNSLGLRGPEMPYEKPAGAARLMVLGDSMPFGSGCATSFPELLEGKLARAGDRPLQVVNAGHPGYCPHFCVNYLRRRGLGMEPDVVLLAVTVYNDIRQHAPFWMHPVGSPLDRFALHRLSVRAWMISRGRLSGRYRGPRRPALKDLPPGKGHWTSILPVMSNSLALYQPDSPPWLTEAWDGVFDALISFRDLCERRRIPSMVVILPDLLQVDDRAQRDMLALLRDPPREPLQWDLPQRRLVRFLSEAGMPYVDLLPAFRSRPDPAGLFLSGDNHFNEAGHELTARIIADHVRKAGLLGS